jgi:uncharacterized protein (DUF488 family)
MIPLYTIGYEGTDISRFIDTLMHTGVKVLADVRAVPLSRKKGFSKRKLAEHLAASGIRYLHFKDLGDPKTGREAARAGRFVEFRRIYGRHLKSAVATNAISELLLVVDAEPTCLMCFERDPSECHRSMVAELMRPNGYVRHLSVEPDGQSALIPRRSTRQGTAAAQQAAR